MLAYFKLSLYFCNVKLKNRYKMKDLRRYTRHQVSKEELPATSFC